MKFENVPSGSQGPQDSFNELLVLVLSGKAMLFSKEIHTPTNNGRRWHLRNLLDDHLGQPRLKTNAMFLRT